MKKQELQALLVALMIAALLLAVLLVVRTQVIDPPPSEEQEIVSEQQNLPVDASETSSDTGDGEEAEVTKKKSVMESIRSGGGDPAMRKHLDIIKQSSRN